MCFNTESLGTIFTGQVPFLLQTEETVLMKFFQHFENVHAHDTPVQIHHYRVAQNEPDYTIFQPNLRKFA